MVAIEYCMGEHSIFKIFNKVLNSFSSYLEAIAKENLTEIKSCEAWATISGIINNALAPFQTLKNNIPTGIPPFWSNANANILSTVPLSILPPIPLILRHQHNLCYQMKQVFLWW